MGQGTTSSAFHHLTIATCSLIQVSPHLNKAKPIPGAPNSEGRVVQLTPAWTSHYEKEKLQEEDKESKRREELGKEAKRGECPVSG